MSYKIQDNYDNDVSINNSKEKESFNNINNISDKEENKEYDNEEELELDEVDNINKNLKININNSNVKSDSIISENKQESISNNEVSNNYELTPKDSRMINDYYKIYIWLDNYKFSSSKKGLTRDFSDGVFFVELLLQIFSQKVVEYHNVSPSMNKKQKLDNWYQIQKRINKRTYLHISNNEISDIVDFVPYAAEKLLERLYEFVSKSKTFIKPISKRINKENKKNYLKAIESKVNPMFKENAKFKSETKENLDTKFNNKEEIFKSIIEEKDNKVNELKWTLEFLIKKIQVLEDDNFKMEEMINRYKQVLGKSGDFIYTSTSNENSNLL